MDIDGDPITSSFSVVSQPSGASASFNGTTVTGMTRQGEYVFRFTASDPTHTVTRDFNRRVVVDDTPPAAGAGRGRPAATVPQGSAVPRNPSSASAAAAAAPTGKASVAKVRTTPRGTKLDVLRSADALWLRDLLDAIARGEAEGLPAWRRIEVRDFDEDGLVDFVRIEFTDGLIWTVFPH